MTDIKVKKQKVFEITLNESQLAQILIALGDYSKRKMDLKSLEIMHNKTKEYSDDYIHVSRFYTDYDPALFDELVMALLS